MSFDPDDPVYKDTVKSVQYEILAELKKVVLLLSILTNTEIKD